MTAAELQPRFVQPYDRARWLGLMRHVFPATEVFATAQPVATADTGAQSIAHLASDSLDGGKRLAVLEVRVAERIHLLRNRVGLRNLVARFIDQAEFHGVLAIFVSADSDYRFTFASRVSEFDAEGNLTKKETAPRRYTYILGPNGRSGHANLRPLQKSKR